MQIHELSIKKLTQELRDKKISCVDVAKAYKARAEKINSQLNAISEWNPNFIKQAQELDEEGPSEHKLFGAPLGIKDLFCTRGIKSTAASKILKDFRPPYSATCVELLQKEGALVLGKTNMDEFAMGSSNEFSAYGVCKNPWNTKKVPGGSSGGSAAATSAGLVAASLGSDTGGSIRQPASFCGIVGVKPTYGSISRYGMIAFASSLDQAGPMAKSVEDCALLLDVMVKDDIKDSTNVKRQIGSLANLNPASLKGKKIGLPVQYFEMSIDVDVKKVFDKCIQDLKAAGAEVIDISLPHTESAVPTYYIVATSEASSNLSRYDGVRYGLRAGDSQGSLEVKDLKNFYSETRSQGFGEEVQRRILLGTFALSSGYYDAFYKRACQVRRLILNDFLNAFKNCDWILSPVSTSTAFGIGEKNDDPIAMYYNDVFTTAASLAGMPAMSLPIGKDSKGMPIGLQIMAPQFSEDKMLSFAMTIEQMVSFQGEPDVW